jgi:hypothetical protein
LQGFGQEDPGYCQAKIRAAGDSSSSSKSNKGVVGTGQGVSFGFHHDLMLLVFLQLLLLLQLLLVLLLVQQQLLLVLLVSHRLLLSLQLRAEAAAHLVAVHAVQLHEHWQLLV